MNRLVLLFVILIAIPSGLAGYVAGSASWVARALECEGVVSRMEIQLRGRPRL